MSQPPHTDDPFDRLVDDETDSATPAPAVDSDAGAAELDERRIRQIATLRRALYRSRSHAIVAACTLAAVAVQLAVMTFSSFRQQHRIAAAAMLIASVSCALGAVHFQRRAMTLHREAKRTHLPDSPAKPDFSGLDDGSQRWRNLEDLR